MELQLSVPPEELTRAEQKILDFINTNTDSFLFLTIGQLAQRLDLSDATVSRFARHAGCRDFKALKARVLEQATGPAVKMAGTLRQEASFSPAAWLEQQQACLEKTAEQLSPEAFDQAVQAILAARRVWIHGKNASGALAQLLHFRLRRLGLPVTLLPAGGSELMEGLAQAGEWDLVILFSFSKLSREGKVILEHSRAAGYRTLIQDYGLTQEEAARRVSKSRPAVANAMRLLALPQEVQWLIEQGNLSAGHGRALLALPTPETQIAFAGEIVDKGYSVRETEQRIRQAVQKKPAPPPEPHPLQLYYAEAERQLTAGLGRRVTISPGKKKGKIALEYYDQEDLNRLLQALSSLEAGKERNL